MNEVYAICGRLWEKEIVNTDKWETIRNKARKEKKLGKDEFSV